MEIDLDQLNAAAAPTLPGFLGIAFTAAEPGRVSARLEVQSHHMAPNGYLHAATVVAIADTCAGFGTMVSLPEGASSFTTIELKANFTGTARGGTIECTATLVHGGRRTQVWDATVTDATTGRTFAMFRCTQMML